MQQIYLTTMFLCILVFYVRAKNKETTCSPNDVMIAMTICQGERQQLSYASQLNNTSQLCQALRYYTDCMKPRVKGCQGPAKMAFDVITSKYTGEPYKCQLDMPTEFFNNVNYQINNTSPSKDYDENSSTTSKIKVYNSLNDSPVKETNDNTEEQSYSVNNSTETTTTKSTNSVPRNSMNTTTVTTIKSTSVNTSSDTYNSAALEMLATSTAYFSKLIIIQIWRQNL